MNTTLLKGITGQDSSYLAESAIQRYEAPGSNAAGGLTFGSRKLQQSESSKSSCRKNITIRQLVTTIALLSGYTKKVILDPSRADGQPRSCLNTNRALTEFNFTTKIELKDVLHKTLLWYPKSRELHQA